LFSKSVKVARFEHAKGRCEGCSAWLMTGKFDYDHDKPVAFGGDNSFENCRCLCVACHSEKTGARDIPAIAKSNRIRARSAGIKKDRSIRAWRLFDGTMKVMPRKR
jgi:5-methylcytosine-specific restriction enzyme A